MFLCQLGDGCCLEKQGKYFYIRNTGYPYPDIELVDDRATNQMESMYYFLFGDYLNRYRLSDSRFCETKEDVENFGDSKYISIGQYSSYNMFKKFCNILLKAVKVHDIGIDEPFFLDKYLKKEELYTQKQEESRLKGLSDVIVIKVGNFMTLYLLMSDKNLLLHTNVKIHSKDDRFIYVATNMKYMAQDINSKVLEFNQIDIKQSELKEYEEQIKSVVLMKIYNKQDSVYYMHLYELKKSVNSSLSELSFVSFAEDDRYIPYLSLLNKYSWVVDQLGLNKENSKTEDFKNTVVVNLLKNISSGYNAAKVFSNKYIKIKPRIKDNKAEIEVKVLNSVLDVDKLKPLLSDMAYSRVNNYLTIYNLAENFDLAESATIVVDDKINMSEKGKIKVLTYICKYLNIAHKGFNKKGKFTFKATIKNVQALYKGLFNKDIDISFLTRKKLLSQKDDYLRYKSDSELEGIMEYLLSNSNYDGTTTIELLIYPESLLSVLYSNGLMFSYYDNNSYHVYLKSLMFDGYLKDDEIKDSLKYLVNEYIEDIIFFAGLNNTHYANSYQFHYGNKKSQNETINDIITIISQKEHKSLYLDVNITEIDVDAARGWSYSTKVADSQAFYQIDIQI